MILVSFEIKDEKKKKKLIEIRKNKPCRDNFITHKQTNIQIKHP